MLFQGPFRRLGIFSFLKKICVVTALLVEFSSLGSVTPGKYLVETWDTSSGLPHNTVRAIAQTPDGYLWIGTENGLARFDGVRFENFTRENTAALPNPNVDFLQVDARGMLWVGAFGHVSVWDGRRLTELELPLASNDQVEHLLVSRSNEVVFATAQGSLLRGRLSAQGDYQWTSSRPAGLSQFAVDAREQIWQVTPNGRLWRVFDQERDRVQIPDAAGRIRQIIADTAGRIWLGTEHQLLRQEAGQFSAVTPPLREGELSVTELFPAAYGALEVVANGHLWRLSEGMWYSDTNAWPAHPSPATRALVDRRGNVWISHFGGGLLRTAPDGRAVNLSIQDGVPVDRVRSLFQDHEGNVWVGVDRGGLIRLRERLFQVLGTGDGLSDPVVLGVCEDQAGAIWASTYGGGLNQWADGKFTAFKLGPDNSPGYLFTAFCDRAGRLWVGTHDSGVFIREGGEFRCVITTNEISLPTRAIYQDRAGTIWLGSGSGVFYWRDGRLQQFVTDTELVHADVRGFAEDATGALWIGTHGNGLHRFQAGQHTALHTADGLPNEFVRALFADRDGSVWVGMYGGGLFRWKDGRLARAAPLKDLPDDVICDFQDDGHGQLWISTHHGLFRVAKSELNAFADGRQKTVSCIVYGKYDGLPSLEFSGGVQPAGCRTRDGQIWFATDSGLVSLQPSNVTINPLPPPVAVESLLVDGELFASSLDMGKSVADLRQPLRIPAGRTQFEFQYTGLSFTAPGNVRFQYQLAGLEDGWRDAGMNRQATYNYLRPGKYIFHVRAANNDGVWNETGTTVRFELLPHFWQRWWFRAGMAAMVAGILWLAYYRRIARLRELERLRLRIARDLHDDVGANLASVALIAEAMEKQPSFGDPADLRRIALSTIDSLRDIVWFIDPARDNLGELVIRMRDTVPALLTGIKFDFQTIVPNPGIKLPPAFRRNVFPIFKEALHNASRHARAGHVDIKLDCRNGGLRLKIQDDGQGFDEKNILPGNGLRNLRRRADEMHGTVMILSAPGQGTIVEFYAPFPQTRGLGFGAYSVYSEKLARKSPHSDRENRSAKL